jgi:hypothetical protein
VLYNGEYFERNIVFEVYWCTKNNKIYRTISVESNAAYELVIEEKKNIKLSAMAPEINKLL